MLYTFYMNIPELLSIYIQILTLIISVRFLFHQMASQLKPDLPWNTTEAYLFVMAAIADNLEPYVYTVHL